MNSNARVFDFRQSKYQRFVLVLGAAILGCLVIGMAVIATVLLLNRNYLIAAILGGTAWFMYPIARFVLREVQANWRWRLRIEGDVIDLWLPEHRSQAHETPEFIRTLHSSEIAAIFTREESYRKFGIVNVVRVFALQLTSGEFVFLGEDSLLGTRHGTCCTADRADVLRSVFSIPMHELPAVIGKTGYLGIVNNEAPGWEEAGMSEAELEELAQGKERSNTFLTFVSLAISILYGIQYLL